MNSFIQVFIFIKIVAIWIIFDVKKLNYDENVS